MFKSFFTKLSLFATILAIVVVVLGAYTRLTDAGLGCPDWPGCYGQLTPPTDQSIDSQKAWTEMIHRYFAGTLGLVILVLAIVAIFKRKQPNVGARRAVPLQLPLVLLGLVIFQALLGMWTVTMLLNPLVVMAHLLGGMATLGLLWWLALRSQSNSLKFAIRNSQSAINPNLKTWATLGLIILGIQIALGGWTSANYAALACPDFPQCQGQWWPSMDFSGAFTVSVTLINFIGPEVNSQ